MHLLNLPPIFRLLIYVYGFMGICSLCTALHPKLRGPAGKPIREAINSWWFAAIAAGITVTAGIWIGVAIVAGVSLWTLREYVGILPASDRVSAVEILAYLTVPLHYGLLLARTPLLAAGTAAWIFVVLPLVWIFMSGPRGVLTGLPSIQWGIALTVMGISYIARLLMLGPGVGPAGGPGLAAFLLTAIMSNDAAQYVFGKLFGRTILARELSPKKTWEGFAGGLFTTIVVAALVSRLVTPFHVVQGALIGAVLSVAGLAGDLLISAIKRDAGVKDTGAVLPQHGGVLDRCDSLLIAAPIFFYGVQTWLQ